MGRTQREASRTKRAAFKPPSQANQAAALARLPIFTPPTTTTTTTITTTTTSSSNKKSPHHVDLLRLAFLEWLLPLKQLTSAHELWDRFMADWADIPGHELPVQSSRPHTLFSHIRALRNGNNMGAMRKEVRQGRAKLTRGGADGDESALKPHQTLLRWYLDANGGAEKSAAQEEAAEDEDEAEEGEEDEAAKAGGEGESEEKRGGKRKREAGGANEGSEGSVVSGSKRRKERSKAAATSLPPTSANIWDTLAADG